jgi:hypothetical protein
MTRRSFLACCSALVVVCATVDSARGAAADPLSGTWTGELMLQGADPTPVTMELKFDGKRAVSGTMTGLPSPAEVKSGTFDPKTGALVLRLGKKDGDAVLLVFEGTVANGAATGHFSGEAAGEFKIARK